MARPRIRRSTGVGLLDVEGNQRVPFASRTEARLLHRVEVDRVRTPAALIAPVREPRPRVAVGVDVLMQLHRRPAAPAAADPVAEEDALAFEVDGDPFEHPTAPTADERQSRRRAQVV